MSIDHYFFLEFIRCEKKKFQPTGILRRIGSLRPPTPRSQPYSVPESLCPDIKGPDFFQLGHVKQSNYDMVVMESVNQ